jgi:hypothetical protein
MDASLILSIIGIALSLVATGISTFLVVRQTRFQRHANQVPVAITLAQEYRSEDFQVALDYVLHVLPTRHDSRLGISHLPEEGRRHARRVSAFFTTLAGLVFFDIVDEEFAIGFFGNRAKGAWDALEPYIVQERAQENNPDFVVFFEDLVCRVSERGPAVAAYRLKLKKLALFDTGQLPLRKTTS